MNTYVARQPIFTRDKNIYGYELLFRDGLDNCVPAVDGDAATTALLSRSFLTFGLEKITAGRRAFINFTRNLIVGEVPMLLPRETTVVEILEDIPPDDAVLRACRKIADGGYPLALDDFAYTPSAQPLMDLADIIKIDFRASARAEIEACIAHLPDKDVALLAEKVETYADFRQAQEMGFDLFQGYFFCKPEVLQTREISGSRLNLLQIMAEASKPDMAFDEIEALVARDVSVTYKMLRYINSAFFKRLREIASIREALVYLGEKEVRRFLSLMAMSGLGTDKPAELIKTSCIRARFCELLGTTSSRDDAAQLFTLGLFSVIDAILDQPMADIMNKLPLSEPIRRALADNEGPLAGYLSLAKAYEKGQWDTVSTLSARHEVDENRIPGLYLQARELANTL